MMWKYLGLAGITVTAVGALTFWLMLTALSMFFPFRSMVAPKLPPLLPRARELEEPLHPEREYAPGLSGTRGEATEKFLRENGVIERLLKKKTGENE